MESVNLQQDTPKTGVGELVLLNGRQAGMRRPLNVPTTFIGRGVDCDVRLNMDGIDPLHCLLALGTAGLQLRDLNSASGTFFYSVPTEPLLFRLALLLDLAARDLR